MADILQYFSQLCCKGDSKIEHFDRSNSKAYLAIIPKARIGFEMIDSQRGRSVELVLIISYPKSACGIIALL